MLRKGSGYTKEALAFFASQGYAPLLANRIYYGGKHGTMFHVKVRKVG
jgi:hypothetical protein